MFKIIDKLYFKIFKTSVVMVHFILNKYSQKYYRFFLRKNGIEFSGIPKFIGLSSTFDNHAKITIGNNVVISEDVIFLTHDYSVVNASEKYLHNPSGFPWVGEIEIGDNTFIGIRAIILPGTCVGKNCIVGAGAVIKGNIPDDSIVIGNPARVVASTSEWIQKKMKIQEQVTSVNHPKMIKTL